MARLGHIWRMSAYRFTFAGCDLTALPSGGLFWAGAGLLVVSDLHFGKSARLARRGGALLPPYETRDTLLRLTADLTQTDAAVVICLGDSFDDVAAADDMEAADRQALARLMDGRRWTWIAGNHDPAPGGLGGHHAAEHRQGALTFRHIAEPGAVGEVSGHFHPKARLAGQSRPCFLLSPDARLILPAYGSYTGGLFCAAPELAALMGPGALAILTGRVARAIPYAAAAQTSPRASTVGR